MSVGALSGVINGLKVAQAQLDVSARNTANVSTPGYSKKILPTYSRVVAGQVIGTQMGTITRIVDVALQRDYWGNTSNSGSLDVQEHYLNTVQQLHGRPEDATSLSASFSNVAESFQNLSATPESTILHKEAVNNAQALASKFNSLSDNISSLRNDIQSEINEAVTRINVQLERIAQLNYDISAQTKLGNSTADLEDVRDQAVKELSQDIKITYFVNGDNEMVVQSYDGRLLADRRENQLVFNTAQLNYDSHNQASFDGGVYINGLTGPNIGVEAVGGRLGGLIALRDRILPSQQAQLDELAHKTALRFEAQGLQLFVDNRTGDVPADIAGSYVGFSAHMSVEQVIADDPRLVRDGFAPVAPPPHVVPPAATPAQIGDSTLINNILNYAMGTEEAPGVAHAAFRTTGLGPPGPPAANLSTDLPPNGTLEFYATHLITYQANQHSEVKQNYEIEVSYTESLELRLTNISAVDLDQEVQEMMQVQQAYSASAQMLIRVEEMFDELIRSVGR